MKFRLQKPIYRVDNHRWRYGTVRFDLDELARRDDAEVASTMAKEAEAMLEDLICEFARTRKKAA